MPLQTALLELAAVDAAIRRAHRKGLASLLHLLWCRRTYLAGLVREGAAA